MGEMLDRLHHEHLERQRRLFPPPRPSMPQPAPPPPPAPPAPQPPPPTSLALERLVRRAENIELMLAAGEPILPGGRPSTLRIRALVAAFYRQSVTALISQRRDRHHVWPRHVAIYLCCTMTTKSLPYIGRAFGGRDHTSVLHAKRRVARLRETDARVRDELQLLVMRIEEATGWREEGTQ